MIKRANTVIILIVLTIFAVSVFAQTDTTVVSTKKFKEFKIGFINAEKVSRNSLYLSEIYKKYEQDFTARESALKDKQTKFNELASNLNKQKTILSDEDIAKKQKELDDLKYSIDEDIYKMRTELKRKDAQLDDMLNPFYEDMKAIIIEISEKEGLSMVIDKSVVLYGVQDYDITDRVINKLNKIHEQGKKYGSYKQE